MASLTLSLLGPPHIAGGDGTALAFRSRKALGLLVYLAIERGREHSRDSLAGLLWPDDPEAAARNSLRVALANLRHTLGKPADRLLHVGRTGLQFARDGDHALDVEIFTTLLATCRAHRHEDIESCVECAVRLGEAIALHRGEFLAGFALPTSAPFEEWLLMQREALRLQTLEALKTLASYHERRGEYEALGSVARRQLILEPWHEPAYRQLMRALIQAGDRTAALAAYETCRDILQRELGVEPDLETHALAEHIRAGRRSPTSVSAAPPAHRLPVDVTPFVGRQRERAAIAARLSEPDVRLVTLVGAGGMGKTRLALEVARSRLAALAADSRDAPGAPPRQAFPDGVFFVSLASLGDAREIVPAIAAAIGLTLHGAEPGRTLLHALRDKRLLLILDNFEHLLDGVGLVVEILQAAPHVQLLATSRERLRLRGEHVYVVEGMEYSTEDAATSSAVRLFVQSARRVQAGFTVSQAQLAQVLRICRLVQGMPLGIELAAAWVEMVPLETIAAEIERSSDFLAFDWHDAPERQRSMRAVFDWSWRLLDDAERRALAALSVFRGGFTSEAAQAVVGTSLRVLTGLSHKSLLRWSTTPGAASRYEIHELLRQFAAEHLPAGGERAAVEARHGLYYLHVVAEREQRLTGNEPRVAVAEIRGELDNVRQAWAWAARQVHLDELDRTAHGLGQFYMLSGLLAEGEQALAVAAARIADTLAGAMSDALDRRQRQCVLSKLLSFQAMGLNLQSAYDQALPVAQQAVELGQASGGIAGEAMGALVWGEVLGRRGQQRDARPLFERALQLVRTGTHGRADVGVLGETEWRAEIWLGILALLRDDFAEARGRAAQALRICRAQGTLAGEMTCLQRLATTAISVGDYAAARRDAEQALRLARALSYPWGEGVARLRLGRALHVLGDYTRAADLIEGALAIFHEIGDRTYGAETLAYYGRLADSVGDYARARDRLEQALELSQAVHAYEPALDALVFRSLLAHHLRNHEQALTDAEQAWQLAHAMGSRLRQAQVLVARGRALAGLRRPAEAVTAYQSALTHFSEIGVMAPLTGVAHAGLAELALGQGNGKRARAHIDAVLTVLADHEPVGLDEPFEVYLTCYRVLEASHDPRAAEVLRTAEVLLDSYTDDIADVALRQSFLKHVAIHAERAGPISWLPRASTARSA